MADDQANQPSRPARRHRPDASASTEEKARSLLDQIGDALHDLMQLEVVTLVTPLTVTIEANDRFVTKPSASGVPSDSDKQGLLTHIDLVDGDIRNYVSSDFAGDRTVLMEFHKTQVEKSRAIVADNLKALGELAHSLIDGARAQKS